MSETTSTKDQANDAMCALGIMIKTKFIPFSQSRNKAEKHPSLNYSVTVRVLKSEWSSLVADMENLSDAHFRDVLTTDYSMGCGHAPSYSQGRQSVDQAEAIKRECETGLSRNAVYNRKLPALPLGQDGPSNRPRAIRPNPADVMHSLVMDSLVLDAGDFEEWASELGYDTDSRSAEKTYRACLDIALKLRGGISESGLQQLREAFQEY